MPAEKEPPPSAIAKQLRKERKRVAKAKAEVSEVGRERMNGPIGQQLSETEWMALKTRRAAQKHKS